MLLLKVRAGRADRQLQFQFVEVDHLPLHPTTETLRDASRFAIVGQPLRLPSSGAAGDAPALQLSGRDRALEEKSRNLLRQLGATKIANEVRVEWNPRLKTCAGRADYRHKLITLNPQLRDYVENYEQFRQASELDGLKPSSSNRTKLSNLKTSNHGGLVWDEIDRTLRHELAHFLAQFRSGRRRILPHGAEWRAACADLGIAGERRCHDLPFASATRSRRFLYKCPNCKRDFPRVRRIRRAIACLACCRAHNRGKFDRRFRLKLFSGGL